MPMIFPREALPKPVLVARQHPNDPLCLNPDKKYWTCSFEWDITKDEWKGCCTGNPCQSEDGKCPDPNYEVDQNRTYEPVRTTVIASSTPLPTGFIDYNRDYNDDSSSSKSTTTTIAVASSVASVAGVIIIGFLIWFFLRQKKKKAQQSQTYVPPPGYMDSAYVNPNDAHAAYGVGSAAVPTPMPTPRDTKRWTFFSKSSRADDSSTVISPVSPMADKNTANNRMSELHSDSMYSPRSDVVAELPEAGSGAR